MARPRRWLTKNAKRNIWRIVFAIPVRRRGDRWRTWHLYALELNDGYYYIGITGYRDVMIRYKLHSSGKGSKWTRLHEPRRILWSRKLGTMHEVDAVEIETATTVQFIRRYGVERVRGGRLVAVDPVLHWAMYQAYKNRTMQNARGNP